MSMIRRTGQGGSVANFIIIVAILASGLIGTAYYLKQHGEQERRKLVNTAVSEPEKSDKTSTLNSDNRTTNNNESSSNINVAQKLPVTGPELSVGELIYLFVLTVTIAGYVSSRRNLARSL
jgi:Flp pilus assembly protein TadB